MSSSTFYGNREARRCHHREGLQNSGLVRSALTFFEQEYLDPYERNLITVRKKGDLVKTCIAFNSV